MSIETSLSASELAHKFIDYFSQEFPPATTTLPQPLLSRKEKDRLKSELCCEIEESKTLIEIIYENSNDVSFRIGSFSFHADLGYWSHDDYPELLFSVVESAFVMNIRTKVRSANKLISRQLLWSRIQPFVVFKVPDCPEFACIAAQKMAELGNLEAEKEFWERILIEAQKDQEPSRKLSDNIQILASEILRFTLEYGLRQERGGGFTTIDLTGHSICIHELWRGCHQNRWHGVRQLSYLFARFSPNIFETYYASKGIAFDFSSNRFEEEDEAAYGHRWKMEQERVKIESYARSSAILTFDALGWFSSRMDSERIYQPNEFSTEELLVFYKIQDQFSRRQQNLSITVSRGVTLSHRDCNLEPPALCQILTSMMGKGSIISWSPYSNGEELFHIWL